MARIGVDDRIDAIVSVARLDETEERERIVGARFVRLENAAEAFLRFVAPSSLGERQAPYEQQLLTKGGASGRAEAVVRRRGGAEEISLLVAVERGPDVCGNARAPAEEGGEPRGAVGNGFGSCHPGEK